MKNLKWYHIALLVTGIIGVIVAPWLFTRPTPLGWNSLNFSNTGEIGDTIGGITAPFVGLVSILLLWWTLRAQLEFNAKQDKINDEQKKFNDANRIMSMEAHILHMNENLSFGFSGLGRTLEGRGVESLHLLADNGDVRIVMSELEHVISRVHVIETALCAMLDFLERSQIEKEEKAASYGMSEMYLADINTFYGNVATHRVNWIASKDDLHWEVVGLPNPFEAMMERARLYQNHVSLYLKKCRQKQTA